MRTSYRLAILVLVPLALAVAACGGGSDDTDLPALATAAANIQPQTEVSVAADDLEYDTDTIVVPAGAAVSITLDNRDGGTLHNLAVYPVGNNTAIFRGDLFEGEAMQTYAFTAPDAGLYRFRCDAHPDMNGAFIAR